MSASRTSNNSALKYGITFCTKAESSLSLSETTKCALALLYQRFKESFTGKIFKNYPE